MLKKVFLLFELFLFALPILHPNIYVRLSIIIFYFVSHQFKAQYYYVKFKKTTLGTKQEEEEEAVEPSEDIQSTF